MPIRFFNAADLASLGNVSTLEPKRKPFGVIQGGKCNPNNTRRTPVCIPLYPAEALLALGRDLTQKPGSDPDTTPTPAPVRPEVTEWESPNWEVITPK